MRAAIRQHGPEYLMEATCVGLLMVCICFFSALLEHPASPVRQAFTNPTARRALMGIAIGLVLTVLIYSPWGKRSGAHFNPAVTLTFLRLGKTAPWDAAFYIAAQFLGATVGMFFAAAVFPQVVSSPEVHYAVTTPGPAGIPVALLAEAAMAFALMTLILEMSNAPRFAKYTGAFIGVLVALCIFLEAPISGASLNPARTFGSALAAHTWTAVWLYFIAPALGMLAAGAFYARRHGRNAVHCAALHHHSAEGIFCAFHSRRPGDQTM